MLETDGIGEVIASSVTDFLHDTENQQLIMRLREAGLQFELSHEQMSQHSTTLEGKVIVISGVFKHHSREQYKQLIEQHGGKNSSSISSKTSFLLAGENIGPSKLEKAQKLGVQIMNEDDFLAEIGLTDL